MAKKITYLLGAGASANAVPVVGSLIPRMRFFLKLLIEIRDQLDGKQLWVYNRSKELETLINEIEKLGTPDTLARIYGLTKENFQLDLLKDFLSCYMLFEQFDFPRTEDSVYFTKEVIDERWHSFVQEAGIEKLAKLSQDPIDNRYIELLSTILRHDSKANVILPENISIVLWNYDHQMEKALGKFSPHTITKLQEYFKIFPRTEQDDSAIEEITFKDKDKLSRIVKLNGTAGFIPNSNHELLDVNRHRLDDRTWRVFLNILYGSRDISTKENKLAFAWNKQIPRVSAARAIANLRFKESDILVIIGYSFPNFNREADRELFSHFSGEKVYIQDLYPEEIAIKLDGVQKGLREKTQQVKTGGSFVLPNEYWE